MSGHKRAIIKANAEKIREFNLTEMALRYVESGLQDLTARVEQVAASGSPRSEVRDNANSGEEISQLEAFDEQLAQIELDTHQIIVEQMNEYQSQLSLIGRHLGEFVGDQYNGLSNEFNQRLSEIEARYDEQIDALTRFRDQNLESQAERQNWLENCLEASTLLFKSLQTDPYMTYEGEINYFNNMLLDAVENYQNGFFEAALSVTQQVYREMIRWRRQIDILSQEYTNWRQLFEINLNELFQLISLNEVVSVMDLEGKCLPQTIRVDDWTSDSLEKMKHSLENCAQILSEPICQQTIDQMQSMISKQFNPWREQITESVYQARMNVLSSQIRMNIASVVVEALSSQGYHLEGSAYDGNDMQSSYHANLMDLDGNKVHVYVVPTPDEPEHAELNLILQDHEKRTPHELRQQSTEIKRSLESAGLISSMLQPVSLPDHRRSSTQNHHLTKVQLAARVNYER